MSRVKGVVRYSDRREARKAGVKPIASFRKRREPKPGLPEGVDFKPRAVAKHEPAKAQLSIRRITPLVAPDGSFDDRGRPAISIESIRDDTISVIRNSHLTFDEIRAKGGPTPATLTKWLERTTQRPQLNTIAAALDACGYEFHVRAKGKKRTRADAKG